MCWEGECERASRGLMLGYVVWVDSCVITASISQEFLIPFPLNWHFSKW